MNLGASGGMWFWGFLFACALVLLLSSWWEGRKLRRASARSTATKKKILTQSDIV